MKKHLLGLLLVPFSLIAFSSAVSFTCEDGNCSPSEFQSYLCTEDNELNIGRSTNSIVECSEGDQCSFSLNSSDGDEAIIYFYNGNIDLDYSQCMYAGAGDPHDINREISSIDNIKTLNGLTLGTNTGGGDDNTGGGNDNTGGGDDNTGGDDNIGGGVISDGFGSLTPVIIGVKDTIFQLIPLVIYIGIGVLISILGFYAVRWLVNWIGGKINSYFSSKRG